MTSLNSPSIRVVLIIVNLILVTACTSAPLELQDNTIFARSLALPGAHLAAGDTAPQGFQGIVSANAIYQAHGEGEDIWFLTAPEALEKWDGEGGLLAWLVAIDALQFPLDQSTLYWIPADPETDRLAFAESNNLTTALAPLQQARLWRRRGDQLRKEGAFESALTAYQASIALNEADPEAHAGLGAAYLGQGQSEASLSSFRKAILLAPNHYWAHRLLGNAYLNLHRYALAANEFTQAYILNPQDTHLLLGIALGQGRSGDRQRALRTLDMLASLTDDPALLGDAGLLRQEFSTDSP